MSSRRLFFLLLVLHAGLLAWIGRMQSPAWDEPKHVLAGISHWEFGTFDLYRVNPPLVRLIAAIPVVLVDHAADWSKYDAGAGARSEMAIRGDFIRANGLRTFWLHSLARWVCIPFSLLGAYCCYHWSRELYGQCGGLLASTLWCLSPSILAHAALVSADVAAAALGVAAAYVFWRWLRQPNWWRALGSGVVLGLAELTKTTWIVLFAIWPLLWLTWRWPGRRRLPRGDWTREPWQLAAILLLGLYVINLGYGFEGTFQQLGDYGFVSKTFGGPRHDAQLILEVRNRFSDTWLHSLPVPLPKNYLMGIDQQRWDFERKMPSYLRGEWRMGGWWYYYLYALVVKVPLGTWVLIGLTFFCGVCLRGYSATWRDELVLLAPIVVVLTLVSSQTGFNHHLRYVLPIFPFAFIWMSKVAQAFEFGHRKLAAVVVVAMAWSIGSNLWVYPHSLSYFNEMVGGPKNGPAHLLNSNIDWGQDLDYLKRWLKAHPEAKPLHLAFSGSYDASIAGIEYTPPPTEPQPGWHALSVNKIRSHSHEYEYFLRFEPVAMAGYSIYIYHITLDDANRVRRELGLSEITGGTGVRNRYSGSVR